MILCEWDGGPWLLLCAKEGGRGRLKLPALPFGGNTNEESKNLVVLQSTPIKANRACPA
jgi:hypothetical protein